MGEEIVLDNRPVGQVVNSMWKFDIGDRCVCPEQGHIYFCEVDSRCILSAWGPFTNIPGYNLHPVGEMVMGSVVPVVPQYVFRAPDKICDYINMPAP